MIEVRPYGEHAALVLVGVDDVAGGAAAAARIEGVTEVVPGAETVLARWAPGTDRAALLTALAALTPEPVDVAETPLVTLPVSYDGPDLADVAARSGCSVAEVVELHSNAEYRVRFCGFLPGFAYLDGLDERLRLPRRDTPRTSVPAGSVAIAAGFAAVYPRASPGGWNLLGRTDAVLWDLDRESPALLAPGTRVRFVPA